MVELARGRIGSAVRFDAGGPFPNRPLFCVGDYVAGVDDGVDLVD